MTVKNNAGKSAVEGEREIERRVRDDALLRKGLAPLINLTVGQIPRKLMTLKTNMS